MSEPSPLEAKCPNCGANISAGAVCCSACCAIFGPSAEKGDTEDPITRLKTELAAAMAVAKEFEEKARERNEKVQDLEKKWKMYRGLFSRIRDQIIGGHGPEEMIRFNEALRKNKKGDSNEVDAVGTLITYFYDLCAAKDQAKKELAEAKKELERYVGQEAVYSAAIGQLQATRAELEEVKQALADEKKCYLEKDETATTFMGQVKRLHSELHTARRAVGFFACVIKSGERWTDSCEKALREAMDGETMPEGTMLDLLDTAWGIIANAHGGNWELESEEWRAAAANWRDRYHGKLDAAHAAMDSTPEVPNL